MTLIDRAVMLATQAHAGQHRKSERGGTQLPFLVHPLDVLKRVWTWGAATEVVGAAAVLHDVYEDTTFDPCWVMDLSPEVHRLVTELTLPEGADKAAYLADFRDPDRKSDEALVIKVADRISNVRDYMLTDRWYAAKYLRRADVLGLAVQDRYEELSRKLGWAVVTPMWNDWNELVRELTPAPTI